MGPAIQVISVFQTNGSDDGFPTNAGADNSALGIAGSGFPLLITSDGAIAAGEEPPVERQILSRVSDGEDRAVAEAEMQPATRVQWTVIGGLQFEPLVIYVAAQVFRTQFDGAEDLVTLPRVKGIITTATV
jgi:hypothetical protein